MVGFEFGGESPLKEKNGSSISSRHQRVDLLLPALALGVLGPCVYFGLLLHPLSGRIAIPLQTARDDSFDERMDFYNSTYSYYNPPPSVSRSTTGLCGKAPDFADFFALAKTERSVDGQDKKIFTELFRNRPHGTYVELGAFDGKRESNTRFLDECLGWNGLLIEADPRLVDKIKTNRPNAGSIFFSPSCTGWNETTMTFRSNIPLTNSRISKEGDTTKAKLFEVPCGPLGPVLEDVFPSRHIDFVSLELKGAESLVLATIDFSKVNIDVLMIKSRNAICKDVCKSRDQVRAIMKANGYRRYSGIIHKSDLYIRKDSNMTLPTRPKRRTKHAESELQ